MKGYIGMDKNLLLRFIRETGIKTKGEVYEKFSVENPEIVGMTIDSLVSQNILRRARYDSPEGESEIYLIPPGSNA
jgi:hypothetical protein